MRLRHSTGAERLKPLLTLSPSLLYLSAEYSSHYLKSCGFDRFSQSPLARLIAYHPQFNRTFKSYTDTGPHRLCPDQQKRVTIKWILDTTICRQV